MLNSSLQSRQQSYQQLLNEFQAGHSEFGQAIFGLRIMQRDMFEQYRCEHPEQVLCDEPRGIPDHNNQDRDYVVVADGPARFWGSDNFDPGDEWFNMLRDQAVDAFQRFEPLAARAGAALPASLRKALPVEPYGDLTTWYSMMYWCMAPEERKENFGISPFRDSADVIEICRLDAELPALPAFANQLGLPSSDVSLIAQTESEACDFVEINGPIKPEHKSTTRRTQKEIARIHAKSHGHQLGRNTSDYINYHKIRLEGRRGSHAWTFDTTQVPASLLSLGEV